MIYWMIGLAILFWILGWISCSLVIIAKQKNLLRVRVRTSALLDKAIGDLQNVLILQQKKCAEDWDEEHFVVATHHNVGRWIRNNWGLWAGSKLSRWFNSVGIHHADDMSGIIFTSYHRTVHNQPIKLNEQIAHYIKYWQEQKQEEEEAIE